MIGLALFEEECRGVRIFNIDYQQKGSFWRVDLLQACCEESSSEVTIQIMFDEGVR